MKHVIVGEHMVASTYQCAMQGLVEYGWQFNRPGSEDTEFDLVIGAYRPDGDPAVAESRWEATRWVAEAIVAAAKEPA